MFSKNIYIYIYNPQKPLKIDQEFVINYRFIFREIL